MKFALLIVLLIPFSFQVASARTVQPNYGNPMGDPATFFADRCLGPQKNSSCQYWAAALKIQLQELLVSYENHVFDDTLQTHKALLGIEDARLQRNALDFSIRFITQDTSFVQIAKNFLLGDDTDLGHSASTLLRQVDDEKIKALTSRFEASHRGEDFNYWFPSDDGASTIDALFREHEINVKTSEIQKIGLALTQTHLEDRVSFDSESIYSFWGNVSFVGQSQTEAESIINSYSHLEKIPSLKVVNQRNQDLAAEFEALIPRLQSGDPEVYKRFAEVQNEMQQNAVFSGIYSQLMVNDTLSDEAYWVKTITDNDVLKVQWAIGLRFDSVTDRLLLRYLVR